MGKNEFLYRDLRGSMTQFNCIRPEDVIEASKGMLTYKRLVELLTEYGLSIAKVVFDAGRPVLSTFYADFDQGLYCEIYLQMTNFGEGHRPMFRELARKQTNGNENLKNRDWKSFYTIDVPLPMQAYDFQRRMYDMEADNVFDVWFHIYKRLDYSNGVWQPETIDYVFAHAPRSPRPEADEKGIVTLYRGMGSLSQPPEQAISWSTHPGNALWFANHSGHGTRLIVAEIAAEDIVAYFPGYSNENEVLVRPGSVRNIQNPDMLPADQETFTRLAVPMLTEFKKFGRQALRFGYSENDTNIFGVHGIHHILRVLYLSLLYFYHSGDVLDEADRQILIYFSILHDVARTNEYADEKHGLAAVEAIHRRGLRIKGLRMSKKDHCIGELIIRFHCCGDEAGLSAIRSLPEFSRRDKERVVRLYLIAKDMDGLDRVRFDGLDYRMLRTPFAARLPFIAGCLLKEDVLTFIQGEV